MEGTRDALSVSTKFFRVEIADRKIGSSVLNFCSCGFDELPMLKPWFYFVVPGLQTLPFQSVTPVVAASKLPVKSDPQQRKNNR